MVYDEKLHTKVSIPIIELEVEKKAEWKKYRELRVAFEKIKLSTVIVKDGLGGYKKDSDGNNVYRTHYPIKRPSFQEMTKEEHAKAFDELIEKAQKLLESEQSN